MTGRQTPVSISIADCNLCPFRCKTLPAGRCMPGDICLSAHSGRQIDRFFKINPEYANYYLHDPFWERRAIAARYASQNALAALIDDGDEVVRRAVAYRLPVDQLAQMLGDPDREVRMTVADRMNPADAVIMLHDPHWLVRYTVAWRVDAGALPCLLNDAEADVRTVAQERLKFQSNQER
jgi:hypothetical protein